jgi:MSHA biogenesis protein MshE
MSVDLLDEALSQAHFHTGRGCGHCNGTGYRGRMGVYELLEMTKAVVDAAHSEDNAYFMEVAKRQMNGRTLRKNAIDLVLSGVTTVSEAMRISNQIEE